LIDNVLQRESRKKQIWPDDHRDQVCFFYGHGGATIIAKRSMSAVHWK
jgi:hypothetical protein